MWDKNSIKKQGGPPVNNAVGVGLQNQKTMQMKNCLKACCAWHAMMKDGGYIGRGH